MCGSGGHCLRQLVVVLVVLVMLVECAEIALLSRLGMFKLEMRRPHPALLMSHDTQKQTQQTQQTQQSQQSDWEWDNRLRLWILGGGA